MIESTSNDSRHAPAIRPSQYLSTIVQPQSMTAMMTAMTCQNKAASGLRFDNDCLPAANQSKDTTIPPRTQCSAARCENVFISGLSLQRSADSHCSLTDVKSPFDK